MSWETPALLWGTSQAEFRDAGGGMGVIAGDLLFCFLSSMQTGLSGKRRPESHSSRNLCVTFLGQPIINLYLLPHFNANAISIIDAYLFEIAYIKTNVVVGITNVAVMYQKEILIG